MVAKMLGGDAFRFLRCMNMSTTTMTTPIISMSMTTTTWRNRHQEAGRGEQRVVKRKRTNKPEQNPKKERRKKQGRARKARMARRVQEGRVATEKQKGETKKLQRGLASKTNGRHWQTRKRKIQSLQSRKRCSKEGVVKEENTEPSKQK